MGRQGLTLRYGVSIPNFAEPGELVELGAAADAAGWDGVFLWDHVYAGPAAPFPVADPWVVLGALAGRTQRARIGPMVTPLARRRPEKVAREALTVDRLSGGRLVLGVGLGNPPVEFTAFGADAGGSLRAARLDEALDVVRGLWRGEPFNHAGAHFTVRDAQFLPAPVTGAIPVWAACTTPHRAPLRRAARVEGVVLANTTPQGGIDPVPVAEVRTAVHEIRRRRGGRLDGYDVVVLGPALPAGPSDVAAYAGAGATWVVITGWVDQLRAVIDGGPPA